MDTNNSIREINFVEIPGEVNGGDKGRLLHFAEFLKDQDVQIRMFADADWDRLLERPVPGRVWLTDHRDMEGYFLREECLNKVLRLGIKTERISGDRLLKLVRQHGRRLGLVRLLSELDSMALPFQETKLRRYIEAKDDQIALDLEGYLRALLQNAKISLALLTKTKERLAEVEAAYESTSDSELIHGKDATCIIEAALSHFGLKPEEGARLLWTSFETTFVACGSTLENVTRFLLGIPTSPEIVGR